MAAKYGVNLLMTQSTSKKRIVITGGSGMVGSRVVELLDKKFEFFDASLEHGVDLLNQKQFTTFLETHKSDVVFHLAAFTNVAEAEKQVGDTNGVCFRLNVGLTEQLASYCNENDIHLVYVSTDYVFDGKEDRLLTEEDAPNPINWYGMTKFLGEEAVKSSGCKYTIMRISYPYGATKGTKEDYIQKIVRGISEKTLFPMFTDQKVTLTKIDDIARAFELVVNNPEVVTGETFHVVGNTAYTPYEIAHMIVESIGVEYDIEEGSLDDLSRKESVYKTLFPKHSMLGNDKFKRRFDFNFSDLNDR